MNDTQAPPQPPQTAEIRITMELQGGRMNISLPQNLDVAWIMLSKALDLFVKTVLKRESEKRVKTLDELGPAPGDIQA